MRWAQAAFYDGYNMLTNDNTECVGGGVGGLGGGQTPCEHRHQARARRRRDATEAPTPHHQIQPCAALAGTARRIMSLTGEEGLYACVSIGVGEIRSDELEAAS